MDARTVRWIAGFAAVAMLLLAGLNLWFGELNQDEGWYLYAAGMVARGYVPYRDFAFTQPPVMPYIYAVLRPLDQEGGLLGGRLLTAFLGLISALLAAALALRHAPRATRSMAGLMAFILAGVNVYQSYFTTVVKTYALCAVWLLGGLLLLTHSAGRRGRLAVVGSAVLLSLAAGTRISTAVALPLVFLALLRADGWRCPRRWLPFAAAAAAALALIFLPFLWQAPEGFMFGVVEYHGARSAGGLAAALFWKAGFLSRFVQAYYLPLMLALAVGLAAAFEGRAVLQRLVRGGRGWLWTIWFALLAVHFMAPFPYDDYQVLAHPLLAAALAASLAAWRPLAAAATQGKQRLMCSAVLLAAVASAFSSPLNQQWFIRGRDRIWWLTKEQADLAVLRATAARVRRLSAPRDLLLTQDVYLAVEARRKVPGGLELGPFSYYPEMERARAERLRVMNRAMLHEMLEKGAAPLAAFSGYGLALSAPAIVPLPPEETAALYALLDRRYRPLFHVPEFGQAHTTLQVYERR